MDRKSLISGNALKIIAAISMLIDHAGLMFFPDDEIWRIIGRLALPIYAFMIAEGCRYTRNKIRYFLCVFGLATVCQTVYFVYDGDTYMSILVTFSISIALIYALQGFKATLCDSSASIIKRLGAGAVFSLSVGAAYALNLLLEIDYGFFGCMLPVFASLLHPSKSSAEQGGEKGILSFIDRPYVHVLMLGIGMVLLSLDLGGRQWYSFLALPLLLLYSGKRGKLKMKYFFYIFYPLHLLLLEGLNMIL